MIIIPFQKLSPEALHGVIEKFVTRDGTDYGLIEVTADRHQSFQKVHTDAFSHDLQNGLG